MKFRVTYDVIRVVERGVVEVEADDAMGAEEKIESMSLSELNGAKVATETGSGDVTISVIEVVES